MRFTDSERGTIPEQGDLVPLNELSHFGKEEQNTLSFISTLFQIPQINGKITVVVPDGVVSTMQQVNSQG